MTGRNRPLLAMIGLTWLISASTGRPQKTTPPPRNYDAYSFPYNIDPYQQNEETSDRDQETLERRSLFEDHIETDRDAFTPSTKTVNWKRWIAETSYSFIDNRKALETHSFPELLLRYGLMERIELRLGWNYEVGGVSSDVSGSEVVESNQAVGVPRESHMLYGFKARVTKQEDWLPDSSLIVEGLTPTSGESNATQLNAAYVFGWRLPNRWRLDSSTRFETDSENGNRFGIWAPSVVLRMPIGERFQVHAEYFGIFSDGKTAEFTRHFFSPGAHVLITPNLELGVRLGWGLNEQSSRFFSNVGFGWRF